MLGAKPKHIKSGAAKNAALGDLPGGTGVRTLPALSTKDKQWNFKRKIDDDNEETVNLGEKIDLVIVDARLTKSKMYHKGKWSPKTGGKPPTCWSDDAETPAVDVDPENRQAEFCLQCQRGIDGECRDFKRLVVGVVKKDRSGIRRDDNDNPILFRLDIKAGSLTNFKKYINSLGDMYDASYDSVLTEISFDPDETWQKLVFSPKAWLTKKGIEDVEGVARLDEVAQVIDISQIKQTAAESAVPTEDENDDGAGAIASTDDGMESSVVGSPDPGDCTQDTLIDQEPGNDPIGDDDDAWADVF